MSTLLHKDSAPTIVVFCQRTGWEVIKNKLKASFDSV